MSSRSQLIQRLNGYWKMELANVWLIPACMAWMAYFLEYPLGWLSWAAMVPMCALLLLGGLYWRAKWQALLGDKSKLASILKIAGQSQWILAGASTTAFLVAIAGWVWPALSASLGDRITASVAGTLALLEYVNYYHRQLQHFDHAPDWKRLLAGKGFRPSQMARDLVAFRVTQTR